MDRNKELELIIDKKIENGLRKINTRFSTELFFMMIVILPWIAGLVIAKGFLQVAFALFPPYAWYLLVEKLMIINGLA